MHEFYDEPDDESTGLTDYERREAFRALQEHRVLAIKVGDSLLALGRWYARRGGWYVRKAAACLWRSASWYEMAGLGRQSRTVWRLAQRVHRSAWRNVDGMEAS